MVFSTAAGDQLVADLTHLVALPTVGSQKNHDHDLATSASVIAQMWTDVGCKDVQVIDSLGAPAIVARFPAPVGAPTLCFYAHHDVQPAGAGDDWDHPPFTLVRDSDRLYGRGSADDKGAIAAHLATLRAWEGQPPIGVVVLIEGEEEIGSPSMGQFLDQYADLVKADGFVILDSGNWQVGQPAFTTTLRGVCDAIIEVRTLRQGVHSGQFGGVYPDALTTLCRLVATLHNEAGEVTLDGSGPATSFNVEIDRDDLRKSATVVDSLTEIGSGTLADRLWAGVSVSVIGMDTVSIEEASNTLIPSARAKVSIRIPPGTTPTKILDSLENHCQTHVPWGAEVQVIRGAEANPAMVDTGGPLVQAGMKAYKHAFGVDPVFIGQGGAIPLVNELMKAFPQAEFLITAIADPGSHMHGPNESVSFMDLCRTVSAQVALMEEYCVVKSG